MGTETRPKFGCYTTAVETQLDTGSMEDRIMGIDLTMGKATPELYMAWDEQGKIVK
jgi:hypothetical protein